MTRSFVDDVVVALPVGPGAVGCDCRGARRRSDHHDRLLAVETDPDAVLELFELAVTWSELDYTGEDVLPPESWLDFAEEHGWGRPDRVIRLFALATDVAMRGSRVPADSSLTAADILHGEL